MSVGGAAFGYISHVNPQQPSQPRRRQSRQMDSFHTVSEAHPESQYEYSQSQHQIPSQHQYQQHYYSHSQAPQQQPVTVSQAYAQAQSKSQLQAQEHLQFYSPHQSQQVPVHQTLLPSLLRDPDPDDQIYYGVNQSSHPDVPNAPSISTALGSRMSSLKELAALRREVVALRRKVKESPKTSTVAPRTSVSQGSGLFQKVLETAENSLEEVDALSIASEDLSGDSEVEFDDDQSSTEKVEISEAIGADEASGVKGNTEESTENSEQSESKEKDSLRRHHRPAKPKTKSSKTRLSRHLKLHLRYLQQQLTALKVGLNTLTKSQISSQNFANTRDLTILHEKLDRLTVDYQTKSQKDEERLNQLERAVSWQYATVFADEVPVYVSAEESESDPFHIFKKGEVILVLNHHHEGQNGMWMQARVPGPDFAIGWILVYEVETNRLLIGSERIVP